MNEVAKVFLATNSDYKYTDVSTGVQTFASQGETWTHKTEDDELTLRSISKNVFPSVGSCMNCNTCLSVRCVLTENHDLPVRLPSWPQGKIYCSFSSLFAFDHTLVMRVKLKDTLCSYVDV